MQFFFFHHTSYSRKKITPNRSPSYKRRTYHIDDSRCVREKINESSANEYVRISLKKKIKINAPNSMYK